MLFILTGDIQIGKTCWLQALVGDLEASGRACAGVLAPGDWLPLGPGEDGRPRFEKLGISNELLPGHERVRFARRRDLAQAEGSYDEASQSAQAKLGWAIDDAAIERVNAHFAQLAEEGAQPAAGLLVVDELGQLELKRGAGLTEAVRLLDAGPTGRFPVAVVVVRDWLAPLARERFAPAWGEPALVAPYDTARVAIFSALGI